MIPILYLDDEKTFSTNGVGRLTDILSCTVTEERNGVYECEFDYPVTGKYYQTMVDMVNGAYKPNPSYNTKYGGIVACYHDDKHDIQPFDLYSVSSPMDGIATFSAHHVSYRLCNEVVTPFSASSVAQVIGAIPAYAYPQTEFTFWTDKVTSGNFEIETPKEIRSILGGESGSILDTYGSGEYEFDKFNVKLYQHRGNNSGVSIRYGKNLVDLTREFDSSGAYNAIAPFWSGTDSESESNEEVIVYLNEIYIRPSNYDASVHGKNLRIKVVDLSGDFEGVPTQSQLKARALEMLNTAKPWRPDDNITVDFIQLWQTTEYENVAALQRVSLCDKVSVYFPEYGIVEEEQEVVKVIYDVLMERYTEMELGTPSSSLASNLRKELLQQYEEELKKIKDDSYSMLDAAIEHATQLITGGLGGHVVFTLNADGEPEEILIMDTADKNTAVNVWRFNSGGLGHSHSGYNGPFNDVALTMDGAINANMITTGQLNANLIKVGIIQDQKQYNYWNMQTGEFQLKGYATTDYTDTKISSSKSYTDDKTAAALASAKSYSNTNLSSAKSYSDSILADYETNLNQAKIFNKLTNNGKLKGIFMKDNQLYINASYIYSGTLKIGGNNNENGLLEILDAGGTVRLLGNKDGFTQFDGNGEVLITQNYTGISIHSYENPYQTNKGLKTLLTLDQNGISFNKQQSSSSSNFVTVGVVDIFSDGSIGIRSQTTAAIRMTVNNAANGFRIENSSSTYVGASSNVNTVIMDGHLLCYERAYATMGVNFTDSDGVCKLVGGSGGVLSYTTSSTSNSAEFHVKSQLSCEKNFYCWGSTKQKVVITKNYGAIGQYCYETASPYFGDIGHGVTDSDGICIIQIDDVFFETVNTSNDYYVFLQKEGPGDLYVSEKTFNYFIVTGTSNTPFSWEIKAKQIDCEYLRNDVPYDSYNTSLPYGDTYSEPDYALLAENMMIDERIQYGAD